MMAPPSHYHNKKACRFSPIEAQAFGASIKNVAERKRRERPDPAALFFLLPNSWLCNTIARLPASKRNTKVEKDVLQP
jgi:hypothetical protein